MRQIADFIKKIPKPYQNQHQLDIIIPLQNQHDIAWYYYILFIIFYCIGINVLFTKNLFVFSIFLKVFWIIFLLFNLYKTPFSFAEGFIFYTICLTYLFHFFDIFLLFFFVIFIPNGKRLLQD